MSETATALTLEIEVAPDEVRRYLGYPPGERGSARSEERLDALWPLAMSLAAPRGAYTLLDRESAVATGMPEPAELVGAAVCTIGAALEEESARRAGAGEMLDALVLDAIGSAAAEAAADALNLELCSLAAARGLAAWPRVSPGYGEWDTACQGALLATLPIAELGISLTSGSMMVPRKSVSFAVRLDAARPGSRHDAARCARCGRERCRHRVAPRECA